MKTSLIPLVIAMGFFAGLAKAEPGPAQHVNASEATKLLVKKDAKPEVLDVRTPQEFAEGHLPGAVNVDFMADDFEAKAAALDKSKTYLVYCQGGGRSGKSLKVFKKLGFKSIIHLDGGFSAWRDAGGPEEKK